METTFKAKPKYFITGDKAHFTPKVAQASRLTILSPKEFIDHFLT